MKNTYKIVGDIIEIYANHKGEEKIITVSERDLDELLAFNVKWSVGKINKNFYAMCTYKGQTIYMHDFLMKPAKGQGLHVDHINRNGLCNVRSNLEVTSHEDNLTNRTANKNSKTGVLGVCWVESKGKYLSQIQVPDSKTGKKRNKNLGWFDTLHEAHETRVLAELVYYPKSKISRKFKKMMEDLKNGTE